MTVSLTWEKLDYAWYAELPTIELVVYQSDHSGKYILCINTFKGTLNNTSRFNTLEEAQAACEKKSH